MMGVKRCPIMLSFLITSLHYDCLWHCGLALFNYFLRASLLAYTSIIVYRVLLTPHLFSVVKQYSGIISIASVMSFFDLNMCTHTRTPTYIRKYVFFCCLYVYI